MFQSAIVRVPTGLLNTVSDALPGGSLGTDPSPKQGRALGQLGQGVWFDSATIRYDPTIGRLYAGHYRYVKLSAVIPPIPAVIEPPAAEIPVTRIDRGQLVFWDYSVDPDLYQVTLDEALPIEGGTGYGVRFFAGVCLNPNWVPGEYSWIQDAGIASLLFADPLSETGIPGIAVYPADIGPGLQNARADVDHTIGPSDFIGITREAPTAGQVSLVELIFRNYR